MKEIEFNRKNFDRLVKIYEQANEVVKAGEEVYTCNFIHLLKRMEDLKFQVCRYRDLKKPEIEKEIDCPVCNDTGRVELVTSGLVPEYKACPQRCNR